MSALRQTREHDVNGTSKRVQISTELIHVYNRTVRSMLNQVRDGHRYCQARRKGLVTKKDLALRVKFAKRIKNNSEETCGPILFSFTWTANILL